MSLYVVQTRPHKEVAVCYHLKRLGFDAFVPMKKMLIRKNAKWTEKAELIFPQYVFLDFTPSTKNYYLLRQTDGFVRFLGNGIPESVSSQEEAYLRWLRNDNKPMGISSVHIYEDGRKEIVSGALLKYQDDVIEWKLRQNRAVVTAEIMGRKRRLSLAVVTV